MATFQLEPRGQDCARSRRWAWWPLLPLYPYGQRRTVIRELVPNCLWTFEQLHGVWYVAVPIRMTLIRVGDALLVYAPIPPTEEVVASLRDLEKVHGSIRAIVLGTSSGLEHKLPVPALARAFPGATIWLSPRQWSFPIQLPSSWIGFPRDRTKILFQDGVPYPDQLAWIPLGPLDLGLGTFLDVACLDRATGTLLVTDSLVSITTAPPPLFDDDPTPLLFHARDEGSEPLTDTPANRSKGWRRIVLFANFFRPASVSVPSLPILMRDLFSPECCNARSHYGFYPFRWSETWQEESDELLGDFQEQHFPFRLAPVLERLVFPRAKSIFLSWLKDLSNRNEIRQLISAHYHAPQSITPQHLANYADLLEKSAWAPSEGSWKTLASIDRSLLRLGVVNAHAQ